jgi:glycosyltransferase involved in cell wall biosynthesis
MRRPVSGAGGRGRRGRRASVTVVIPYGGRRRHLAAVLWSLAAQDRPDRDLQVVVVECPSSDGRGGSIEEPLRRLQACWRRFDRREFAPAGARNRGLEAAEGDIVISIDDDMVVPPWFVTAHVRRHAHGPVGTFGLRRFIRLPGDMRAGPDAYGALAALPDLEASASNRAGHVRDWRASEAAGVDAHPHPYHLFHGCNISYDRRLAEAVGGWCEAFDGAWGYEDIDFGARLHAAGAPIVWAADALALHLEGEPGAVSRRRRGRNLRLIIDRVDGYGAFRHAASCTRLAVCTGTPSNERSTQRYAGGGYAAGSESSSQSR